MKKSWLTAAAAIITCIALSGCADIKNAELPSPTPEPTPEPTVDTDMYFEEHTTDDIPVPSSLEELSGLIDMPVLAPSSPIEGMELKSLGYDGSKEGALRYQSENGVLLYTFHKGISEPSADGYDTKTHVSGFDIYFSKNEGMYTAAFWVKGGNTYRFFAEPAISEDDAKNAVKSMITVSKSAGDSDDVLSEATLAQIVGFPVELPVGLPADYSFLRMYAMNGETPVIIYESKELKLTFAKCEGTLYPDRIATLELPKGDNLEVRGIKVVTYRAENGYCIAEWQKEGYGYSITVTDKKDNLIDIKEDEMSMLIECYMGTAQS